MTLRGRSGEPGNYLDLLVDSLVLSEQLLTDVPENQMDSKFQQSSVKVTARKLSALQQLLHLGCPPFAFLLVLLEPLRPSLPGTVPRSVGTKERRKATKAWYSSDEGMKAKC